VSGVAGKTVSPRLPGGAARPGPGARPDQTAGPLCQKLTSQFGRVCVSSDNKTERAKSFRKRNRDDKNRRRAAVVVSYHIL